MRPDHLSYTRLLKAAVLGAVIGVIFDLAVTLGTSPKGLTTKGAFSIVQVPSAVAFLLVGFAAGWLFELFKAQTEVTEAGGAACGPRDVATAGWLCKRRCGGVRPS
jgi:F0F1-type ATP synthase assembly protein I